MSKARKLWTIVGAVATGGAVIAAVSLAGPIAEAGFSMN